MILYIISVTCCSNDGIKETWTIHINLESCDEYSGKSLTQGHSGD